MVSRKKKFNSKLSFKKADFNNADVRLEAVGISLSAYKPEEIEAIRDSYTRERDWLNFGFLGNDPKFEPSVTLKDVMPQPEDFVEQPFRMLSATVVGAGTWKATDFTNEAVLRKSTKLLDGKPLYKDHETDLDNWVGLVNGVKWTKGFNSGGVNIPAGIDAIVAVDAKTNPKVARGVLMGSIYSNSVTVDFEWEMSHPFENEYDFYNKIGSTGSDGKMIRRVVTKVNDYHESSLVWLGADPFAKAIMEDGTLKNVDKSHIYKFAKVSYSKSHPEAANEVEPKKKHKDAKKFAVNFAIGENTLMLAKVKAGSKKKKKYKSKSKNSVIMEEFIIAFIAAFGKELNLKKGDKPTTDEMIAHLGKLSIAPNEAQVKLSTANQKIVKKLNKSALAVLNAGLGKGADPITETDIPAFLKSHSFVKPEVMTELQNTNTKLSKKVKKLKPIAKQAEVFLNAQKDEAIRLYKLAVGEKKVDEAVIKLFKTADSDAVEGLLKQYTKKSTSKFSGKCKDCGSTKFTFQSSSSSKKDDIDDDGEEIIDVSADAIRKQLQKSDMNIGRKKEKN